MATVRAMILNQENVESRISARLIERTKKYTNSDSRLIPVQHGEVYWKPFTSKFLTPISHWATFPNDTSSIFRTMLLAFKKYGTKMSSLPPIHFKMVSDNDIPTMNAFKDIHQYRAFSSEESWSSQFTTWLGFFNLDELPVTPEARFTNGLVRLYHDLVIEMISGAVTRSKGTPLTKLLGYTQSSRYRNEIPSSIAPAYAITDIIGSTIGMLGIRAPDVKSKRKSATNNSWGGLGGEKLARIGTMDRVGTTRVLNLVEMGHELTCFLNEKLNRSDFGKRIMVPFTPLEVFEDGIKKEHYPLMIETKISSKRVEIPNPELLFDLESIVSNTETNGHTDSTHFRRKLNQIMDFRDDEKWSDMAIGTFELLSDIFNGDTNNIIDAIDPIRASRLVLRYALVTKNALLTVQNEFKTNEGAPLTVNSALFPLSTEHLTGFMFQVFGGSLSSSVMIDNATKLGLDPSYAKWSVISISAGKSDSLAEKIDGESESTASDSWILLWEERKGSISESSKRIVKLSYKSHLAKYAQHTKTSFAFASDKESENLPVFRVYDIIQESGNTLMLDRKSELLYPNASLAKQNQVFNSFTDILARRLSNFHSMSEYLGLDQTIMHNMTDGISSLLDSLGLDYTVPDESAELNNTIVNLERNLYLSGALLLRLQKYQEMLSKLT